MSTQKPPGFWGQYKAAPKLIRYGMPVAAVVAIAAAAGSAGQSKPKPSRPSPPAVVASHTTTTTAKRHIPAPTKTTPTSACPPGQRPAGLGYCVSTKPETAAEKARDAREAAANAAAGREAAAEANDQTVCAGDDDCIVARALKRKIVAGGLTGEQSTVCVNDVANHFKCLVTMTDQSSIAYDVSTDPTSGTFIYQASGAS
jgi:hypothetical protein